MSKVRNILLIGATGNGKSTLANVLIGKSKFKEGGGFTSTTRNTQAQEFTHKDIKYKVIDTVGLNDTSLSQKETLEKLIETCEELKRGINQIFFVVKNKLTEIELENFNLLKEVLFGENVYQYTTVVRTDFKKYRNSKECEAEIKLVQEKDARFAELIRVCNAIVFINNPSIEGDDFSDEEEEQNAVKRNQKLRDKSREKLLEHLEKNCAIQELVNLNELKERVSSYLTKTQKLEQEIAELEQELMNNKKMNEARKKELEKKLAKKEEEIEQEKNNSNIFQGKIRELQAQVERRWVTIRELRAQVERRCLIS